MNPPRGGLEHRGLRRSPTSTEMRRIGRIGIAGALAAAALLAAGGSCWANPLRGLGRMFEKWGLFQDIEVSGYNTITFQQHRVQGSVNTFLGQRWDTDNLLTQSSIHAEGSIYKEFGFQLDFSASGYGPKYSRWLLGYVGHDTALYYGDLNVSLSGNEFVSFRKTLKGWQLDQVLPRSGVLRYFESSEKGIVRRQTFPGNNTAGPYFLTYTPIIEGSEVIKINEERMVFGRDYRLDYETGELWFEPVDGPPRIVPETDTISASYLSYGYGGTPATLRGLRVEMPFMKRRMLVGYTLLEEKRPGKRGDTVGYHEDIYQGSGTTGPFDTTFRPIVEDGARVVYKGKEQQLDQALIVTVDNVEQKEGVDFDSHRYLGRIVFRRAVPPTALVVIKYYYELGTREAIGGGSKLWGIDAAWRVSRQLSLKFDYGHSFADASGQGGAAKKLTANLNTNRFRIGAQWRSIDPTFSFLNAVGFYRHEKGYQVRADWELGAATTLYFEQSDLKTSQGYSFGYSGYTGGEGFGLYNPYGTPIGYGPSGGAYGSPGTLPMAVGPLQLGSIGQPAPKVSLSVTAKRRNYGFRFAKPRWPGIQLDIQEMENVRAAGDRSSYQARQLRVQYVPTRKPFSISLSWSDTSQASATPAQEDIFSTSSTTKRFQGSITYNPSEKLSFAAHLGRIAMNAGPQSNSRSRTLQLSARWMPSDKLTLSIDRSTSESTGTRTPLYGGYGGSPGGYGIGFSPGGYGSYTGVSPYGIARPWQGAGDGDQPPAPPEGGDSPPDGGDEGEATPERTHYADSSTNINLTYQPSRRLSFDLSLGRRVYRSGGVGYLADSDQTYRSLSAMWQVSDALSLQATYGTDTMRFLEEDQGTIANKMLALGLNFRPPNSKWGASVMYNKQDGSSPTYVGFGRGQRQIIVGTNLRDLSGRIYYRIGESTDLYLQLGQASFSGGYAAFDKQTAELGIERRLSDTARITMGYRYIRNITDESGLLPMYSSVATQSQDYIASTFLLSFTMNFRGGTGRSSFRAPTSATGYYAGYGGYGFGGSLTTFGGYRPDVFGRRQGYGGMGPFGSTGPFGTGYGRGTAPGIPGGVGVPGGTGKWRERGPKGPGEQAKTPAAPPDPWEAVGDEVSLW